MILKEIPYEHPEGEEKAKKKLSPRLRGRPMRKEKTQERISEFRPNQLDFLTDRLKFMFCVEESFPIINLPPPSTPLPHRSSPLLRLSIPQLLTRTNFRPSEMAERSNAKQNNQGIFFHSDKLKMKSQSLSSKMLRLKHDLRREVRRSTGSCKVLTPIPSNSAIGTYPLECRSILSQIGQSLRHNQKENRSSSKMKQASQPQELKKISKAEGTRGLKKTLQPQRKAKIKQKFQPTPIPWALLGWGDPCCEDDLTSLY